MKFIESITIRLTYSFVILTTFVKSTYVRSSTNQIEGHRQMKGEMVLVAEMTDYPGIPSFKKDPEVSIKGKVHAIFQPQHGSLTIQYDLHGLKQSPVCRCCGIEIHDGDSCHTAADVQPWPFYNTEDQDVHGDPWNQALACYTLNDYSGETKGSFGIYTGLKYDDYNKKIVVLHDESGFKIGCGVLYPQDWME